MRFYTTFIILVHLNFHYGDFILINLDFFLNFQLRKRDSEIKKNILVTFSQSFYIVSISLYMYTKVEKSTIVKIISIIISNLKKWK